MKPADDSIEARIVAALDAGAGGLRAGTAYRLQQARAAALARLGEQPERAGDLRLAPAFGGGPAGGLSGGRRGSRSRPTLWLGLALVVAMAVGYQQWRAWREVLEVEEVDAALLSSDLPIDAYLDRGFQNWLKTHASDDGS